MPVYEYRCPNCGELHEEVRTVEKRDLSPFCYCGTETVRIWSESKIATDKPYRTGKYVFPNLDETPGKSGDMTFGSRAEYKEHLAKVELREIDTAGTIGKPHGNKVVMSDADVHKAKPRGRKKPPSSRGPVSVQD
jgi:putative FmdB family regulatory protein